VHEDVKLLDPNFVEKVELVFKEKQDIGLLGFVGTSELPTSLAWWQAPSEKLRGHVIQEIAGHEKHLVKGSIGYFDDLVAVDGLCFFMRSRIFTDHNFTFDEKNFFGYDFYDIDTCLSVLEMGFKIAVADILVLHKSIGDVSAKGSWKKNAMALEKKWIEKGYKLPFTQKTFINSEISEITEIRI